MSEAGPVGGAPDRAICRLSELADPGALGFSRADGESVRRGFVVRRGAQVFGYVDSCPHAGPPLALTPTGYLTAKGEFVICSTHGALFRIDDGLCVAGPCVGRRLRPWPVEMREGAVWAK